MSLLSYSELSSEHLQTMSHVLQEDILNDVLSTELAVQSGIDGQNVIDGESQEI